MLESDKYAYVNIGGGVESIYIRIKKATPMPESDKNKLVACAQRRAFPSPIENAYCMPSKAWGDDTPPAAHLKTLSNRV